MLDGPIRPFTASAGVDQSTYPSSTEGMWGFAVCSYTWACETSASNAASKAYSFEDPCWLRR